MTDRLPPLRFGYHGSPEVPLAIARAAGHEVELVEYAVADPFRLLREGGLDMMIVKFTVHEPDLACSAVLATDDRAAILGAHHPLAARTSVSIEELADYESFDRPGTMPRYVWDEVVPPVTPGGRPIRRGHRISTTGSMIDLVSNAGAVHISLLSLADVVPPSIRVVPIDDLPPAPVAVAWVAGRRDERVRAFVTAAERAQSNTAAEHEQPDTTAQHAQPNTSAQRA